MNQNPARALQLAARIVSPSSNDYRDLLWLGDLLGWADAKQQAETVLRRALELGSHTPETWIALVDCLARAEKWTEAEAVVQQAQAQLPADRQILVLARSYEALSRHDRAEEYYLQALRETPTDAALVGEVVDFFWRTDQLAKAESFLRKLEHTSNVRRKLAIIHAERGDVPASVIASLGDTIADQRLRAFIMSRTAGQEKEALKLFDQTISKQALAVDEHLLHARICTSAAEHLRSREILLNLLSRCPEDAKVLAACVAGFRAAGENDEANAYLIRLQRREPHSARTKAASAK